MRVEPSRMQCVLIGKDQKAADSTALSLALSMLSAM